MALIHDFEPIARGLYLEGLAVDLVSNVVWYSDVIAGGVHGLMPDGGTITLNKDRMWTGGILVNEGGDVLSSGAGGIMWNDPRSGRSGWLLREIAGEAINGINEMIPDGTGGIYFGTVDIENIAKGIPTRPASLYRLTVDGKVIRVADGLGFANGIILSADRTRLFYNDTFDATYVFDVLPDLTLQNRRRVLAKEDCDGMALDADGHLWITGYRSSAIVRATSDGKLLPPVETPADAITQIRFGGPDLRAVYITSVPLDGGDSLKVGVLPTERRSILYRGRSDIAGTAVAPTRFAL